MYQLTATLATPDKDDDYDVVFPLSLPNKGQLHKVERAFINALHTLVKLTEDELAGKGKPFDDGGERTTVTFTVEISKDGSDFGGYSFRWPNQTPSAVEFLRGMIDGVMKETGNFQAKQRVQKGKGPK